jgi:signal transduction histidine kinase
LVAQAQAVNLDFRPEAFDLVAFCQHVTQTFWSAYETTHHLEMKIVPNQLEIVADKMLLQRMLNNLLSNAVKYSPRDSTVCFALQSENDVVHLRIEDNGIGIPETEQSRIFDLFYRATNTDLVSGTGLGLTIVKEVVELHNGQIHVQSQVGVGTTFVVTLPRQLPLHNL